MVGAMRLPDGFLEWLKARLPPEGIDAVNVGDLLLCFDALQGSALALGTHDARIRATARHVLASMANPVLDADELAQLIHERVLVHQPRAVARLETYTGRGALVQWLRAVATMLALEKQRSARANVASSEEDQNMAFALAAMQPSPESLIRRRHDSEHLTRAINEGVASLPAQERTVLKLRFVDGLSPDDIGRMFGVHRTTALRWLERAQERLKSHVKAGLQEQLRLSGRELDSMILSLNTSLPLHLSRVFRVNETT